VRGGEEGVAVEKEIVQRYLQSFGETATALDNFHIHGWRWHTRSLIREVGRLHKLALKSNLQNVEKLQQATDYVIDFNLRGLHKIETNLFFPWMRQQLTYLPKEKEVAKAFESIMDELESDRAQVAQLGSFIRQSVAVAGDATKVASLRSEAIQAAANQSAILQDYVRTMLELEDMFLVPAVTVLVPEEEQKSFSNKVLRGLGLLDSRLHLVSMYEAVEEDQNHSKERELFRREIPSLPQMMIPRWKRNLYAPKTYMLE
jgi:hypothetical protein